MQVNATHYASEEVQWRREQLVNYLETVILPNDDRLQKVIDDLKHQLETDRTSYKAAS